MGNSSAARRSPAETKTKRPYTGRSSKPPKTNPPSGSSTFRDGGTGKTFLFNAIIAKLRTLSIGVLAVAPTGIAALLLRFGQTAHSCFKIPNDVDYSTAPGIQIHHRTAERIRQTRLIIIDEISMLHGAVFDYIDRTIRPATWPRIRNPSNSSAANAFSSAETSRQLPPVAPGKGKYGEISASIASSPLFQKFKHIDLKKNMRVDANEVISRRIWTVAEELGTGQNILEGDFELAQIPPGCEVPTLRELIEFCFPKAALGEPRGQVRQHPWQRHHVPGQLGRVRHQRTSPGHDGRTGAVFNSIDTCTNDRWKQAFELAVGVHGADYTPEAINKLTRPDYHHTSSS
ncbi:hypothetical protein L596_004362 [Steinernema carpocapsae]|uniref:ATP-dependent DNA helicase n=1 Tax=Steinernema carpocapsae TaxID=34508 RepID=A0A4U8UZ55_STECR|nr:hypothetical protein L596_004362 [Steinernema carpocapsae]